MTDVATVVTEARDEGRPEDRLEPYRRELTGYCYRMLGSPFEAEDAVQDTMVRAWRGLDRFDGRSSLRSWLYRIATNVCLDTIAGRKRRAMPMDLSAVSSPHAPIGAPLPDGTWVEPIPDARVLPTEPDPADVAVARDSIRLAFVAALQHLPPRQRAVLILRDVLAWRAAEVADLLDTSVAAVNSALQRARATLPGTELDATPQPMDEHHEALLSRYVDAFERFDIESLVLLLHEDATHAMPPYDVWLRGPADIASWLTGPGSGCQGSRLVRLEANGRPAFGQYRSDGPGGRYRPFSIQMIDIEGDRIKGFVHYVDERLFPVFGLPLEPDF